MARIRTIKPEFFTSEDIVGLPLSARLLYIALWCEADREGRLYWKPQTFRIRYFPADSVDIQSAADALLERGLVKLYGEGFACIPSFRQHQHINPRESQSRLPAPDDACGTRGSRVSDAQVGRERKDIYSASSRVAIPILDYLNAKAGKSFKAVDANLKHIAARLQEGATVDDCKAVIDAKVSQWAEDAKMREYLRPKTLFTPSNFQQYLGSLEIQQAQEVTWE